MRVFKTACKIIGKNLFFLIPCLIGCIAMAVFVATSQPTDAGYLKIDVAIINHEEQESEITKAIKDSISPISTFVEVENETIKMQDALFFQKVQAILIIPNGFSERFFTDNPLKIEKMSPPDSYASFQIDLKLNSFYNTVNAYKNNTTLSTSDCLQKAIVDINKTANIQKIETTKSSQLPQLAAYANFAILLLTAAIGNIVATVVIAFKRRFLVLRNACSPINNRTFMAQQILAITLFALIFMFVYVITAMVLFPSAVFSAAGLWIVLNIVCFLIVAIALGYLVSTIVKNEMVVTFAMTVLSMVMCFTAGAFVPRTLLSSGVKLFGMFMPSGWFIQNIEFAINNISISGAVLGQMIGGFAIQLGFAVFAILASLAISKIRKKES